MPAQFDGFEAGVSYQFGDVGFGPVMVDITGKGRSEPGIFGRTKSKDESTSRLQHAARFGEVVERCCPEVDGMDSEDLVERPVCERQPVAASEEKFDSLLGHQPPMPARRVTVHHRREVYSTQRTARDDFG